ncbi:HBL/NHE enterotoxin family protein [Bacillus thuringiensis]|uniref:HBL/NHE enterotoxin family protein n=1 Tax=Bacillus thuringiensis TaxID=1428 RepID=UPI00345AD050
MKKRKMLNLAIATTVMATNLIPITTFANEIDSQSKELLEQDIKTDFHEQKVFNYMKELGENFNLLNRYALAIGQMPNIEENVAPGLALSLTFIKGDQNNWLTQFNPAIIGVNERLRTFMEQWKNLNLILKDIKIETKATESERETLVKGLKKAKMTFTNHIWRLADLSSDFSAFQKKAATNSNEMNQIVTQARKSLSGPNGKLDKMINEMDKINKEINGMLNKVEDSSDETIKTACRIGGAVYDALAPMVDGFSDISKQARGKERAHTDKNENEAEIKTEDEDKNENEAEIKTEDEDKNENEAEIKTEDEDKNENEAEIKTEDEDKNKNEALPKIASAGERLYSILENVSAKKFAAVIDAFIEGDKASKELKRTLMELKNLQEKLYHVEYNIAKTQMQDEELQKNQQLVLDFSKLINRQSTTLEGVKKDFDTIYQDLSIMIDCALTNDNIVKTQLVYFNLLCAKLTSQIKTF